MNIRNLKNIRKLCAMSVLVLTTNLAIADDVGYELRLGLAFSDNIRRTATGDEEEIIGITGIKLNASRDSSRFSGSVTADLEYRTYQQHTFDDENFSFFSGNARFRLIPNFLTWNFEDRFGKVNNNPFAVETPETREDINVFSTGPEFSIRLSSLMSIELEGTYSDVYYENSNLDAVIVGGRIALRRALSPSRFIAVNATADRIEYDSSFNTNYDRRSVFVSIDSEMSRGTVSAKVGANEIEIDGREPRGTFVSFALTRDLTAISSLKFGYDLRFSDSGNLFLLTDESQFGRTTPNNIVATSDPFENQRISVRYRRTKGKAEVYVALIWNKDDFETQNVFDRRRFSVRAGLSRALSRNWIVGLDLLFVRENFEVNDRTDDDYIVRFDVERRLGRNVGLVLEYIYRKGDSDGGDVNYEENRYLLTIRYRPDWR